MRCIAKTRDRPDLYVTGVSFPFMEVSGIVALTAGVESLMIDVVTLANPLRLASYALNMRMYPPNRIRFDYPGSGDLSDAGAICHQDTTNQDLPIAEVPIYGIVPPLSRLRVSVVPGTTFANGWLKLTGWYFPR